MNKQGSLSRQATVRLRAGDLIERGFDNEEIVEILEVSLSSVKRWRQKVEQGGLAALARKHGSGQFSALTPEQLAELKDIILKGARAAGYPTDRWTSRIVADLIRNKWNISYCGSNVRSMPKYFIRFRSRKICLNLVQSFAIKNYRGWH